MKTHCHSFVTKLLCSTPADGQFSVLDAGLIPVRSQISSRSLQRCHVWWDDVWRHFIRCGKNKYYLVTAIMIFGTQRKDIRIIC